MITHGGIITINKIEQKVLDIGIPNGATSGQVEMLQKAIKYGAEKNVRVEINVVK